MQIRLVLTTLIGALIFSCGATPLPQLQISSLFSDHMVLQQLEDVPLWGKSSPGLEVTVSTSWGAKNSSTTNSTGEWHLTINTPTAGGPHTIHVSTWDSTIVLRDVLLGEVWLASGQSNMEMPLKGWPPNDLISNSEQEISAADYPGIRMFTVSREYSLNPLDSLTGAWIKASPESVGDFSAAAYFFALRLYRELDIPIGIIHSSWGGTPVEAWTSEAQLRKVGEFANTLDKYRGSSAKQATDDWFNRWQSIPMPNTNEGWQSMPFNDLDAAAIDFDDTGWYEITLPGRFDFLNTEEFDGAMWFRRTFIVDDLSSNYTLTIGAIDDMDETFVNGEKVGGLNGYGFWNVVREITLPNSLLKKGVNTIAIRAIDTGGPGSFTGPMTLTNSSGAEISIEGNWKHKTISEIFMGKFYVYDVTTDLKNRPDILIFHPRLPSVLFNAMLNPLVPYKIKGVIWYQGEANVGRHEQYAKLFPNLIHDWRKQWNYDFPFYFVQIAPYIYNPDPSMQQSQKLRDAQRLSLSTKHTGMVVTLDIGNPTNIHPANKQTVGERLAGLALANDYGKDLIASGPLFSKVMRVGKRLELEFDHAGSGLIASAGGLSSFEIAGSDKKYLPADAYIEENKVLVSSPQIPEPEFVRYAWRDDSVASLFNAEGLPASSFNSE